MEDVQLKSKPRKRLPVDDGQKPVHVIAVGSLVANIHLRQAPSGYAYFAYNIKRRYKSLTTGNEIYSSDFFAASKSDLIAVITEASTWIAKEEEKSRDSMQNAA